MFWALTGSGQTEDAGSAPTAPGGSSGLVSQFPNPPEVSSGFNVNTGSREQVREFYQAVYSASEETPLDSSAAPSECIAGTNSVDYRNATQWRINWFRALSGVPTVLFSDAGCAEDQAAALMVSINETFFHTNAQLSLSCYDPAGTNAAQNSNLILGANGPDAITAYMREVGAENFQAGHRRWFLYPQTQTMASGDIPMQSTRPAANAAWVVDTNFDGPRPATRAPFVAWPPPGYVPDPVVYPRWSFALSNADFSNAFVYMASNGVSIPVVVGSNQTGFGENSVVWWPKQLDPNNPDTIFPFNGEDTVYQITINNVGTSNGPVNLKYAVTVFDPAVPGPDYVPIAIDGTNRPSVNENNLFACAPSSNPNNTGYQWVASRTTNGALTDNSNHGLTNFTIFPAPIYPLITNQAGGDPLFFHLTHTNPAPQLLQFKEVLLPATNATLHFESLLGYATSNEIARLQASTDGGEVWVDLFTQVGLNGTQKAVSSHTVSLAAFAGQPTLLRFDYDYLGGSYYGEVYPYVGWRIQQIALKNTSQLIDSMVTSTTSTNLNFTPTQPGVWVLQAQSVLFGRFAVGGSPLQQLIAVTNRAPTAFTLSGAAIANSQIEVPFVVFQGSATKFQLREASQIEGPWRINTNAILSISVPRGAIPGSYFQFTAPLGGGTMFYRVVEAP